MGNRLTVKALAESLNIFSKYTSSNEPYVYTDKNNYILVSHEITPSSMEKDDLINLIGIGWYFGLENKWYIPA